MKAFTRYDILDPNRKVLELGEGESMYVQTAYGTFYLSEDHARGGLQVRLETRPYSMVLHPDVSNSIVVRPLR